MVDCSSDPCCNACRKIPISVDRVVASCSLCSSSARLDEPTRTSYWHVIFLRVQYAHVGRSPLHCASRVNVRSSLALAGGFWAMHIPCLFVFCIATLRRVSELSWNHLEIFHEYSHMQLWFVREGVFSWGHHCRISGLS